MWRVREFHADDLDAAVRLWDDPASSSEAPLFGLSDLIAAVRSHQPAVVAVVGEELAGVAVATVTGDQACVMRISLAAAWRRRGSAARCWVSWNGGWSRPGCAGSCASWRRTARPDRWRWSIPGSAHAGR